MLLAEARVVNSWELSGSLALCAIIHERLDGLLALKASRLHFIERSVHDLLVHGLKLSEFGKVNFHVWLLGHEFTD